VCYFEQSEKSLGNATKIFRSARNNRQLLVLPAQVPNINMLARVLELLSPPNEPRTVRVAPLNHAGTPVGDALLARDMIDVAVGDIVLLEKQGDAKWRVLDIVTSMEVIAREPTAHGTDLGRIV
jgi:hypothetical protein